MHTHTCYCIALVRLQSESMISSPPEKTSSTQNNWARRIHVAALHPTVQEAKTHRKWKTAVYEHLSSPQVPKQPLGQQVACFGGRVDTTDRKA